MPLAQGISETLKQNFSTLSYKGYLPYKPVTYSLPLYWFNRSTMMYRVFQYARLLFHINPTFCHLIARTHGYTTSMFRTG